MKNKYFYTVIGLKDQQGKFNYIYKRVTSCDNLAGDDVISVNIFSTKTEAEKVARDWNYCAIRDNLSYEETLCEPRLYNKGSTLNLCIGYDIKAKFKLKDIAESFFHYYDYKTIPTKKLNEYITDYLYEATRDIGLYLLIDECEQYEGLLPFDFDEYNRTHNDYIFDGLAEYLKKYIMTMNTIEKYWGVA